MLSIILVYSNIAWCAGFSELIGTSSKWYYDEQRKAFDKYLSEEVNKYFKEEVFKPFVEQFSISLSQGDTEIQKQLTQLIPVLSFFIKVATTSRKPSESQVMMKILLAAIDKAKSDIVTAVDQTYQNDTEAKLQALIQQLNIFNLYSLETQKISYVSLIDLSYSASEIKKRLQQRPEKTIQNAHLYLLVSSLHMEIEKQKIALLNYISFPGQTESFIKTRSDEEFLRVANYLVDDGLSYVNNAYVGNLNAWRDEYKSSITNDVVWVRDEGGRKFFSYFMNSRPIEFSVQKGVVTPPMHNPPYTIYDPLGVYFKTFYFSSGASNAELATELKGQIGGIIELMKKDPASFDKFLLLGYKPIKQAFDGWWVNAGKPGPRPQSLVDSYVTGIPNTSYPNLCISSGNANRVLAKILARVGSNLSYDGRTACYPCTYTKYLQSGYYIHQCGAN